MAPLTQASFKSVAKNVTDSPISTTLSSAALVAGTLAANGVAPEYTAPAAAVLGFAVQIFGLFVKDPGK